MTTPIAAWLRRVLGIERRAAARAERDAARRAAIDAWVSSQEIEPPMIGWNCDSVDDYERRHRRPRNGAVFPPGYKPI